MYLFTSFTRRELAICRGVKQKKLKPWPPTKLQNLKGWLHPFGMKLFVSNHPKGLLIHLLLTPCLGMHQTSSPSTTVRRQRHWLRQKTLDEVSANLILFWPQCKRNVRQRKAQEQYYLRVWQKDPYQKMVCLFFQRFTKNHQGYDVGWVEKIIIHSDPDSTWNKWISLPGFLVFPTHCPYKSYKQYSRKNISSWSDG